MGLKTRKSITSAKSYEWSISIHVFIKIDLEKEIAKTTRQVYNGHRVAKLIAEIRK